jgi:hypothetical protein
MNSNLEIAECRSAIEKGGGRLRDRFGFSPFLADRHSAIFDCCSR